MSDKTNLEKKIKRNIYGKPQSILVVFPPGMSVAAAEEVRDILSCPWFQHKFHPEITVLRNALRIDQIHMFAVVELLMRGQCFTDIRLLVSEGKIANMPEFKSYCDEINWDFYLSPAMTIKLKVDVGASPALHEGAIKETFANKLKKMVHSIVSGEDADETTSIYIDVYRYHANISISLAGASLYKRGYRSILSKSAPLREDIAASCMQQALRFTTKHNPDFVSDGLLVPFSGTGTFLLEYWILCYHFAPALFCRPYAIQDMPLFRADHFNYLLKKALELSKIDNLKLDNFYCVDNLIAANDALLQNINNFKSAVEKIHLQWCGTMPEDRIRQVDFSKLNMAEIANQLPGNIFIPINPPYGIRLGKSTDTVLLYKKIAQQIHALSRLIKQRKNHVSGFILCPSEESWSAFCKTLGDAEIETYHMTQGGLDIRVAQFYLP